MTKPKQTQTQTQTSWSYSRLIEFEQCRYRYKLRYVDKVPEEKNAAADRGTQIHQQAEDFVTNKIKALPATLEKFSLDFQVLKSHHQEGNVSLEGEWGFNRDWCPTDYKTAWLRMKADGVFFDKAADRAVVIDYKTGRKFGNEVKHGEQVMLYALATAIREPWVQNITVELWYLDLDELTTQTYKREHALSFVKLFGKRAEKIDKAKDFPPNPNAFTCKWCPYGPAKQNICPHGMTSSMTIANYRKLYP